MTNKITEITFRGTPEQEAQLKEVIAQHKGQSDAMMPVLQKAQEIYGYLPIDVCPSRFACISGRTPNR